MKHIISALVENHFGVLARVSGLFSARGFNIDSLTVGETEDPSVSRMTIVAEGDDRVLEQVMKQLNKLVDVIKVVDLTSEDTIDRELVLVKVNTQAGSRPDIIQIVNTFRAKIVDVSPNSLTIEVTGTESKLDAMLELLRPFGLKELVRTGLISMARKREIFVKVKERGEERKETGKGSKKGKKVRSTEVEEEESGE